MLYIRMFISVIVSLYTSRVVLQTLGVEDYGIYGVVGGIVAMMGSINASMSGATSRFLTFELGRGDFSRLSKTFSSALLVHIIIAVIVLVLAETVGLWFLCNKLVIPEGRMTAAHWVYQLSILSAMLTITQVPYNSSIIAHEKMDIYAYVEILNVSLKLLIVYLLQIGDFDKLILYAILMFAVSLIIIMVYRIYCLRKFEECKFHWIWDKEYLKPLISFSGWDLYGNMSVVFFTQGIAMLLNMFFGPILNAANNISSIVQGTIKGFAFNVTQAFRPQIIKQFAKGNTTMVNQYVIIATRYTLLLFSFIAVPLYFEANYILHLWLGIVPTNTVTFLRIILLGTIFNLANNIINIPIHAKGKMKLFSLMTGSCFLLSLPLMYMALKLGVSAKTSYLVVLLAYIACMLSSLYTLKKNIPSIKIKQLVSNGYGNYIISILPGIFLSLWVSTMTFGNITKLSLILFLNSASLIICALYIFMKKEERMKCVNYVHSKIFSKKQWDD